MSYMYYTPVVMEEHGLFASELAVIATEKLGIVSSSGKPHTGFISAFMQSMEKMDENVPAPLYYETSRGLARVYIHGLQYIERLAEIAVLMEPGKNIKIDVEGKGFVVKRKGADV